MTVVEVGEAWRDRFAPASGWRCRPTSTTAGGTWPYGYVFYGGLAQYSLLGPAALDGDEGCYAIPVPDGLGLRRGRADRAVGVRRGGLRAAAAAARQARTASSGSSAGPGWSTRTGWADAFASACRARSSPPMSRPRCSPDRLARAGACRDGVAPADYAALAQAEDARRLRRRDRARPDRRACWTGCPRRRATGGTINLVGERPLGRPVQVDVGRVHYDYVAYLGTRGPDIGAAYGPARNRSELRPGGVRLDRRRRRADGPDAPPAHARDGRRPAQDRRRRDRTPVATRSWSPPSAPLARATGDRAGRPQPQADAARGVRSGAAVAAHGGRGFDDIVVIVASVPAIEAAMPHLAPDGLLVVFGGLARGTMAALDLSHIYLGGAQITGSAGSTIRDQAAVLREGRGGATLHRQRGGGDRRDGCGARTGCRA